MINNFIKYELNIDLYYNQGTEEKQTWKETIKSHKINLKLFDK